ncbi:MAG: branched-chain amino acid ABC transporter permease [bacterium]|nr:branched-chain amino acid ABC transporter permease [bacterium]
MFPKKVLIQQLINGIVLGCVYALIALGYTMVYGIMQLINFAHGEIYMIGAFVGVIGLGWWGAEWLITTNPWIVLSVAALGAALFAGGWGLALERLAYRPLRGAGRLQPLITALGASIFLQNFVMVSLGAREKVFPDLFHGKGIQLSTITLSASQIAILVVAPLLMLGLTFLVKRTKLGIAMRATAQDLKMASLCGINPQSIIAVTFVLGSALAAIAGVLVGSLYGVVSFYIGYQAGLKAFTAAVLGGIGNIPGAMLGGFVLGMIEALGAGYISSEYKDVYAFVVLIIILLLKPGGLLGERVAEKV